MRYAWLRVLLLGCLLIIPAAFSFGANGKIRGTVRDVATKQSLPGANVVVMGTALGAMADAQGQYTILNVSPGQYRLQASVVGYRRVVIENVRVNLDQTIEQNFDLPSEAVEVGEVLISAERRVVDKNRTSTKSTVTSDEISNLPMVNAIDVLNTTPGAYKGFVRGGKITETKTIVDGVDITDAYYALAADQSNAGILTFTGLSRNSTETQLSTGANINFSAVEQMALNTGALTPDNAGGTAGTVTYALKEGRGKLTGGFNARVSQFNGLSYNGPDVYWDDYKFFDDKTATKRRLDSLRGLTWSSAIQTKITADSTRYQKLAYSKGKYIDQNKPTMEFEGFLGGNVTEDWRFYMSGRFYDTHGRLPNERSRQADITLKTAYDLTNDIKLDAFGIVNDKGKLFGWKNSVYADLYRYFLEGAPRNDGLNYVGSLKLTHVLSPATFYEVQLSQTYKLDRYGYTDGNGDGICGWNEDGDFLELADAASLAKYVSSSGTNIGTFFRVGNEADLSQLGPPGAVGSTQVFFTRPQFYYEKMKTIQNTIRADITSQVNFNHQLKAGFQLKLMEMSRIMRNSTLGADGVDSRQKLFVENWTFYPNELGVYASDRMEFGGLVLNIGARLDRFDFKVKDIANYYNYFRADTVMVDGDPRRVYVPIRSMENEPALWFFSPRIGVSHPVGDQAAMFFSYSRTAITPRYSQMYNAYNYLLGVPTSLPNAVTERQDLVKSSNYEIGIQWEFMPAQFGVNFTAYMRDVENYARLAVQLYPATGQTQFWLNTNGQYADARGVEVTLTALRKQYLDFIWVSGRASYAYTYVKASSWTYNDGSQKTAFQAGDSTAYNNKLPFDDFSYYNKVQNNVAGTTSTLTGGYDREHRISYTMVLGFPFDIQLSSIGTFQSGFYYPLAVTVDPRVAGRQLGQAPWNKMVDFRLEKGFRIDNIRFAVYADVKNAFNWVNIIGYDNTTTGATLWERSNVGDGTPDPTGTLKRAVNYADGSMFYDIPREFYFGVRLEF
jgi:hypothetical protein